MFINETHQGVFYIITVSKIIRSQFRITPLGWKVKDIKILDGLVWIGEKIGKISARTSAKTPYLMSL